MKIICKKNNKAEKFLGLVTHLLESECMDYPVLKDDLVIEITLKNKDGHDCPNNDETITFDEKDIANPDTAANIEQYYYNNDALTKLYNRGKYERDINKLQEKNDIAFACIYIDAVGLHEINNHLGHAAGDEMLCSIAEGIRKIFADDSRYYRIGGDEFVVFCFNKTENEINEKISSLKKIVNEREYEISVGVARNDKNLALMEIINRAEYAMRCDKQQFYNGDGAKRQMRNLNHKLEKILTDSQDASQFLKAIASEYKGVYMVDPVKDTCRYIYIPAYFQAVLEENDGVFSKSIRAYCTKFICEEDRHLFEIIYDYDKVTKIINEGNQIEFTYHKTDGSTVHLQITAYDANSSDSNEILFIFMDGDKI